MAILLSTHPTNHGFSPQDEKARIPHAPRVLQNVLGGFEIPLLVPSATVRYDEQFQIKRLWFSHNINEPESLRYQRSN